MASPCSLCKDTKEKTEKICISGVNFNIHVILGIRPHFHAVYHSGNVYGYDIYDGSVYSLNFADIHRSPFPEYVRRHNGTLVGTLSFDITYTASQIQQNAVTHNISQHAKYDAVMETLSGVPYLLPELTQMVIEYVGIPLPIGPRLTKQVVPVFDLIGVKPKRQRFLIRKIQADFCMFQCKLEKDACAVLMGGLPQITF